MDVLYTGDIPKNYKYCVFNNYYIDLYDTQVLENNHSYSFYPLYLYDNQFFYEQLVNNTGSWGQTQQLTEVSVTNNFCYRRDFSDILIIIFMFVGFGLFLLNLITSIIRKGGVLGGLF